MRRRRRCVWTTEGRTLLWGLGGAWSLLAGACAALLVGGGAAGWCAVGLGGLGLFGAWWGWLVFEADLWRGPADVRWIDGAGRAAAAQWRAQLLWQVGVDMAAAAALALWLAGIALGLAGDRPADRALLLLAVVVAGGAVLAWRAPPPADGAPARRGRGTGRIGAGDVRAVRRFLAAPDVDVAALLAFLAAPDADAPARDARDARPATRDEEEDGATSGR